MSITAEASKRCFTSVLPTFSSFELKVSFLKSQNCLSDFHHNWIFLPRNRHKMIWKWYLSTHCKSKNDEFTSISNRPNFSYGKMWLVEMTIFVKIAYNFGRKIQMGIKSVQNTFDFYKNYTLHFFGCQKCPMYDQKIIKVGNTVSPSNDFYHNNNHLLFHASKTRILLSGIANGMFLPITKVRQICL